MLNFGKKNSRFARQFFFILTLVLAEKKFLNETKNHNPPLQVKWSVPSKKYGMGFQFHLSGFIMWQSDKNHVLNTVNSKIFA